MTTKRYLCVAVLLAVCLLAVCPAAAVERTEGLIAAGTKHATPFYVIDSKTAGPTVVITGGMHGDEPGGARAAEHIRFWTIRRGKLIIVPRLNVAALTAEQRLIPDAPEGADDLNRNFPKTGQPDKARGAPAGAVWAFVKSSKPDWLLDLHEGFAFHKSNPKSTGASIISLPKLKLGDTVKLMLDAVNASVSDEGKKLVALRGSADGSLVRAGELNVAGAMALLMKEALWPNLVQTIEGGPALVHGGPFANIAHGCNSLIATHAGMALGDIAQDGRRGVRVDVLDRVRFDGGILQRQSRRTCHPFGGGLGHMSPVAVRAPIDV